MVAATQRSGDMDHHLGFHSSRTHCISPISNDEEGEFPKPRMPTPELQVEGHLAAWSRRVSE